MRGQPLKSTANSLTEQERLEVLEALKDRSDSPSIIPELITGLGDSGWRVRKLAGEILKEHPSKREVGLKLVESIRDKDNVGLRNAALDVLIQMGPRVTGFILEILSDIDVSVRKFAVDIIGQIDDPSCEKLLIEMIDDTDENVRMTAVEWLGSFDTRESHDALAEILSSSDISMKFYALQSLSKQSIEVPLNILEELAGNQILRRGALEAMGGSSQTEAVHILMDGLKDKAAGSRQAALRALARLASQNPVIVDEIKVKLKAESAEVLKDVIKAGLESLNVQNATAALRVSFLCEASLAAEMIVLAARDQRLEAEAAKLLADVHKSHPAVVEAALPGKDDPMRESLQHMLGVQEAAAPETMPASRPEANETVGKQAEEIPEPAKVGRHIVQPMTQDEFTTLRGKIYNYCGIRFKDDMKFLVERRTLHRVNGLESDSFSEYIKYLDSGMEGEKELTELIANLTTNETYFFREGFQLDAFSKEILPTVVKAKKGIGENTIRILSAGCSTGEEPYTIAILLHERKALLDGLETQIIGTDISEKVISVAKKGIYSDASFRVTDDMQKQRYFERLDGKWRVRDSVKEFVRFEILNLMDSDGLAKISPVDILFCRNVIIYFDEKAKKKLVLDFYSTLSSGGYLLLGHSESLLNISTKFKLVHLENDIVYQKPF